jgi:ankyrin repeat protein
MSPSAARTSSRKKQKSSKAAIIENDEDPGSDHADAPVTTWNPQNEESTCEFTHTIKDYAQKRESGCKKAEYSATTVDDFGNRWRLIVYVNGNGRASNHHLSLFLQVADADELPFGWKKAVSYVLTLEHPKGSSLGYAKRNPDKTFKLCPKAIDWGWSQFITSDRIQQEGYVLNDSLTVRASVTVKSSSVSIDKEDAELYLKCAVEEGNAEAVKTCLTQGASVNCQFKDDLYTPLHTACSSSTITGSLDVLNLLLERGADGNACNKWRETPLLIAANNGHTTAVKALLKSGADPSLCSEAGWSALTFAAHKGYDDIVTLLLQADAPVNCRVTEDLSTPLHKACAGGKPGHLSAVKQLLDAQADVHALNKWRETPLLTAANHGQAAAVKALLNSGADPCKCTDTGWSPLSIAAYKGHDEVVSYLLDVGAPTEEADPTLSALLQAATKGLANTVDLLLRHGADHTVTTKKGDTALSILVEQNLIDAAVEMVTEYNASIPRCSRDRKKVQRARLLINLRIKQQRRDGLLSLSTDEDETDYESDGSNSALHDETMSPRAATPPSVKKKKSKRGNSSNESLEAQARAAEEALLLELEQEESKAQKDEAVANSKRAKKKKKKERERLQKLKEEQEQREQEEKEAKQRECVQKLKEEEERKERLLKEKEQRQREKQEAADRERTASAKRKEREEMERRQREQEKKEREKRANGNATTKPKGLKKQPQPSTGPTPNEATPTASKPVVAAKKRGWETKSPVVSPSASDESNQRISEIQTTPKSGLGVERRDNVVSDAVDSRGYDLGTTTSQASGQSSSSLDEHDGVGGLGQTPYRRPTSEKTSLASPQLTARPESAPSPSYSSTSMELPGISMYRQEKLADIFQRCAVARSQPQSLDPLRVVKEGTIKAVVYRWIARAAHGNVSFLDCIIPSWTDFDLLSTFFQRQFISESRKGTSHSNAAGMVSMEALKEAGNALASLCHNHAENLVQASRKLEEQLPQDWSDSMLSLSAAEVTRNGLGSMVVIDWANRAQVCIPSITFAKLRDRYAGPPNRILTAIFGAKKRYELLGMIVSGTTMDYRLSPSTKSCMERECGVSAELWSDPFSTSSNNLFCGHFPSADAAFGGLPPFAKEGGEGGEIMLLRRGGTIAVLPPFDNLVASLYVRRMIDVIETGDQDDVPISFVAVLPAVCFLDSNRSPTISDLPQLDTRLNEARGAFVRFAEVLHPGQHTFHVGNGDGRSEVSHTGSLFVLLQNETARGRFAFGEVSMLNIIRSMSVNMAPPSELPIVPPIGFSDNFPVTKDPASMTLIQYQDPVVTQSPRPQPQTIAAGFGAIGGASLMGTSSIDSRRGTRRGRLFDLIDDGDDDNFNDVDVVSGMLSNLNVALFQNNPTQDVDIEAISLMGIGGTPTDQSLGHLAPRGSHRTTSRFA